MVEIVLPRAVGSTPVFTIGSVSTGPTASVTQTGTTLNPVLNFVFPTSGGIAPPFAISDTTGLQAALDGKQPLDAGLTALGNLTTPGLYYLSAADVWSAVTVGSGLTFSSGTLSASGGGGSGDVVGPASSIDGRAALFDGTTGKLLKVGGVLTGTNTGDQTITLTGEATGSGTGSFAVTLTNASVIGKVLTGYTSGAGTVAATDTILQAIQKLNGNDALKANLASPTFTGTPAAPTASAGTNTTQIATTAFVTTADNLKANIADTLNTQTGTTYTLQASDNGKVVELNNASAVTVTAPVLTVGFNCLIRQIGAGQVTVATSSTTLRNRQSHTKLAGQWAEASIAYRATNEFVLSGDTAA